MPLQQRISRIAGMKAIRLILFPGTDAIAVAKKNYQPHTVIFTHLIKK